MELLFSLLLKGIKRFSLHHAVCATSEKEWRSDTTHVSISVTHNPNHTKNLGHRQKNTKVHDKVRRDLTR